MMKINKNATHQGKQNSVLSKVTKNIPGWALLLPTVLLFVLIVWRPICMAFYYAFFDMRGIQIISFAGLENFKDVLTDTAFIQTLINTVKYVAWSLIIGLPLPFFVAVMLNEMICFKGYFKTTAYLPVLIPSIATCLIWRMIYIGGNGGLLNMVLENFGVGPIDWLNEKGLVIPLIVVSMTWQSFGGSMIMYLASLQSVDQSLYEAARLDGAKFFQRFRYVLFPHMRGILILLAIRQIIGVFQVTEQPLVMTGGGPNGASMSLGLTNYFYAFKFGQMEKSMALGVVCFIMLFGLTFLYFKLDRKINE